MGNLSLKVLEKSLNFKGANPSVIHVQSSFSVFTPWLMFLYKRGNRANILIYYCRVP